MYTEIYLDDCKVKGFMGNDFSKLGEYSSKEKAMKVLDQIQGRICKNYFNKMAIHDKENQSFEYSYYDGVFQMPQDDEVLA